MKCVLCGHINNAGIYLEDKLICVECLEKYNFIRGWAL
jgi:hypothetical protein